ncbi:MAG: hypothetical protein AAGE86_03905 [Pseudomonadota bacterium]
MARKFASRAEELRHHRKCFELALELQCTPKEAEKQLALMEIRERQRAKAKTNAKPDSKATPRRFERWEAPHMLRD